MTENRCGIKSARPRSNLHVDHPFHICGIYEAEEPHALHWCIGCGAYFDAEDIANGTRERPLLDLSNIGAVTQELPTFGRYTEFGSYGAETVRSPLLNDPEKPEQRSWRTQERAPLHAVEDERPSTTDEGLAEGVPAWVFVAVARIISPDFIDAALDPENVDFQQAIACAYWAGVAEGQRENVRQSRLDKGYREALTTTAEQVDEIGAVVEVQSSVIRGLLERVEQVEQRIASAGILAS